MQPWEELNALQDEPALPLAYFLSSQRLLTPRLLFELIRSIEQEWCTTHPIDAIPGQPFPNGNGDDSVPWHWMGLRDTNEAITVVAQRVFVDGPELTLEAAFAKLHDRTYPTGRQLPPSGTRAEREYLIGRAMPFYTWQVAVFHGWIRPYVGVVGSHGTRLPDEQPDRVLVP